MRGWQSSSTTVTRSPALPKIAAARAFSRSVRATPPGPGGVARTLLENARAAAIFGRAGERVTVVDELCHPRMALASLGRPRRLVALVHHLAASERAGVRAAARLQVE